MYRMALQLDLSQILFYQEHDCNAWNEEKEKLAHVPKILQIEL